MKKYIGIITIILLHFLFKAIEYGQLIKTRGVVVETGKFEYGSSYNHRRARDIVPYPIAKFKGPLITKEVKTLLYKPEEIPPDSIPPERYAISYIETDEYITTIPWGSYFLWNYNIGDSVDVIYDPRDAANGRVCEFFSFWLTLPAICVIILLCFAWVGICILAKMRHE